MSDGHWSGVEPGETFSVTLEYDASYMMQQVKVPLRGTKTDEIDASELKTAIITGKALQAKQALFEGSLVFATGGLGTDLGTFSGVAALAITPEIQHDANGAVEWRIGRDLLELMTNLTFAEMDDATAETLLKVADESILLRTEAAGGVVYVEGTATLEELKRATKAKSSEKVDCELCKASVQKSDMRCHMGGHILLEDSSIWENKYKKMKPDFPCGLCGIRPSLGQALDDTSLDVCTMGLTAGSTATTWKPVHACKLVDAVQYTMGNAEKCSTSQPSTNRPVKCATCKDVFVWSYSLRDHYEKRHPGIAVPPAMQSAMKLRTHEEEWLKMVRKGKTPKACKVPGCPCGGKGL